MLLAAPAGAAEVKFPFGSSIGLAPPPGLQATASPPGFADAANNVTMLMLELPHGAYMRVEGAMGTEAAKQQGIIVDTREMLFTEAGPALLSAGSDTRENMRKWMLVAQLPNGTAVVSVRIPDAALARYPDAVVRAALASLTERPVPVAELLTLLPYTLEDLAGFRVVTVLQRNTVVLTEGPRDDAGAVDQPHMIIGAGPSSPVPADDRARFAQTVFANLPGFVERRITMSEMLRLDGQPVHEIRADARNAITGDPVVLVQWLRFASNSHMRIVAVTTKDRWNRDFPKFRAIRDGIEFRK
jgi:hypothetical protein